MTHNTPKKESLKIAAPYYGALSHPTRGLSNLYFLLDINPAEKKVAHMHVSVWNPADSGDLGNWLRKKGVQTLVCNTIESCHQHQLLNTGIQVESISCSDIVGGIKEWLANTAGDLVRPPTPVSAFNY